MRKDKLNNELVEVVVQAFYGNGTVTSVKRENVDMLILGILDEKVFSDERVDRTINPITGTESLVIIYNKYEEKERRQDVERYFERDGYVAKPLAVIPELDLKIYSRCLACRMYKDGILQSLQEDDYEKVMKYLAM